MKWCASERKVRTNGLCTVDKFVHVFTPPARGSYVLPYLQTHKEKHDRYWVFDLIIWKLANQTLCGPILYTDVSCYKQDCSHLN